jgi:hypothetical protein
MDIRTQLTYNRCKNCIYVSNREMAYLTTACTDVRMYVRVGSLISSHLISSYEDD